ncbi:MAG TPA: PLP-dependent aminotransferase family protein [Dactylosporangium sp.]|jgi:GntR family transcriptional regulator/MocR family aminotransferase|nr:PLP-dependent aminotransferase family protein [Dactylosporangium sp.]
MDLHISLEGRGDRTDRIYRQLRDAILDGRLRPGERVPPSRELARSLSVARNTVATAYDRLVGDGFLRGRAGAGTFVAYSGEPQAPSRRAPAGPLRPAPRWAALEEDPPPTPPARYDLRIGHPDASLFPMATWRRLVAHSLRASAEYRDPAGYAPLRAAIARHAGLSRSVRAAADDVLVTSGAQQAIDLVGRVLVEPGALVAVEEPGYRPVRRLFASHGARVAGVPVDADGIVVDAIPAAARLVYVTPSHQHPLGTAMSLDRRAALLAWAQRHGAAIVEDDYDSEFRFSDRPLEPLQSLDRAGRVIYVGSFSKTLLPSLRLGFLVAPEALRPALRAARRVADWHGEPSAQAALAAFIDEGLLQRHLRTLTRVYGGRHELVVRAVRGPLAPWLTLVPSSAGLHVAARAAVPLDVAGLVRRARAAELALDPLDGFYAEPRPEPDPGLAIGYGAVATADLPEALDRLVEAVRRSC